MRGLAKVKYLNAGLGWPIQGLLHVYARYQHESQLTCARRAFASLHATSSTRDWPWARLPYSTTPHLGLGLGLVYLMTQIPDTYTPHSIIPKKVTLSVALVSCVCRQTYHFILPPAAAILSVSEVPFCGKLTVAPEPHS